MRAALARRGQPRAILPLGLVGEQAELDPHAGSAQARPAAPRQRVRIAERRDHARDAGGGHRRGAGGRAAVVIARLQRAVEGGAACGGAGGRQRLDLGVRPAGTQVRALAHDPAVAHDDGAHHRIG